MKRAARGPARRANTTVSTILNGLLNGIGAIAIAVLADLATDAVKHLINKHKDRDQDTPEPGDNDAPANDPEE